MEIIANVDSIKMRYTKTAQQKENSFETLDNSYYLFMVHE